MIHISLGGAFSCVGGWVVADIILEALRPAWAKWRNHPPEKRKSNWRSPADNFGLLMFFVLTLWWLLRVSLTYFPATDMANTVCRDG